MTVVDIIVIFVIVLSALFGILRGFVKESISLVKWILATWIAATFSGRLAPMMPLDSEAAAQATAFAILFILVFIVGAMINLALSSLVKQTGLSGADRVFGFLFGILRGGVIILVFVVVGQTASLGTMQWWQDSKLLGRFEEVAERLQEYVPAARGVAEGTEELVEKGTEKVIENVDPQQLMEQLDK